MPNPVVTDIGARPLAYQLAPEHEFLLTRPGLEPERMRASNFAQIVCSGSFSNWSVATQGDLEAGIAAGAKVFVLAPLARVLITKNIVIPGSDITIVRMDSFAHFDFGNIKNNVATLNFDGTFIDHARTPLFRNWVAGKKRYNRNDTDVSWWHTSVRGEFDNQERRMYMWSDLDTTPDFSDTLDAMRNSLPGAGTVESELGGSGIIHLPSRIDMPLSRTFLYARSTKLVNTGDRRSCSFSALPDFAYDNGGVNPARRRATTFINPSFFNYSIIDANPPVIQGNWVIEAIASNQSNNNSNFDIRLENFTVNCNGITDGVYLGLSIGSNVSRIHVTQVREGGCAFSLGNFSDDGNISYLESQQAGANAVFFSAQNAGYNMNITNLKARSHRFYLVGDSCEGRFEGLNHESFSSSIDNIERDILLWNSTEASFTNCDLTHSGNISGDGVRIEIIDPSMTFDIVGDFGTRASAAKLRRVFNGVTAETRFFDLPTATMYSEVDWGDKDDPATPSGINLTRAFGNKATRLSSLDGHILAKNAAGYPDYSSYLTTP